jgi:hypothetical protein
MNEKIFSLFMSNQGEQDLINETNRTKDETWKIEYTLNFEKTEMKKTLNRIVNR